MIKIYNKQSDSAIATYRALRGDYGLNNRQTKRTIGKIVKKLEEIAVVRVSLGPLKLSLL